MDLQRNGRLWRLILLFAMAFFGQFGPVRGEEPQLTDVQVQSTADGTSQSVRLWVPKTAKNESVPLLVFLHSWSGDYRQDNPAWLQQAATRGWAFLHPDFRGVNNRPEACGSALAQQDILDAIDWVTSHYKIDRSRIYLAGSSGGGHMSMLMAVRHPQRFSAVSAWVGISDLAEWHRFHSRGETPGRYAQMLAACCGGVPGESAAVDREYRDRSPIYGLDRIGDLPLDLAAGVHDGVRGSVPIAHSIRAFNAVARSQGISPVSEEEISQLATSQKLRSPQPQDVEADPTFGRDIKLRRHAGRSRLTIFEGGHEGLPQAACAWLEKQSRETR